MALKTPNIARVTLALSDIGSGLLDLVYPPDILDVAALRLVDTPCCARCGYPFEVGLGDVLVECGACMARPPRYTRARAAMAYDAASQDIILEFKHAGVTEHLDVFARQMARAGRELLPDADALVPVPLHPSRLRRRKFNQSTLLANRIAMISGLPVFHGLHRKRKTPTQGKMSAKARRRNVSGAFEVRGAPPARVVLVDDVMTTGATLEACALSLLRAGAAQVDCLTLARVVRDRPPDGE